jgi:hypothetical protein
MPYRPWNFKDGNASQITDLIEPERKLDDRSPFIRYARSAALWAEWVREDVVFLNPEPESPSVMIEGHLLRLLVVLIDTITGTMSVPPAAKDHQQRLLESTQLYVEPIIVVALEGESFFVVANHELHAAAVAYQKELARPNRVRPSDYCLVAVADRSYLTTIKVTPLTLVVSEAADTLVEKLQLSGYAVSPRTDDPTQLMLEINDQKFMKSSEFGKESLTELSEILGLRSLDQSSTDKGVTVAAGKTKVTLTMPGLTPNVQKTGIEYPYGSLEATIKPFRGANMWSLRDFRVE